MATIGYDLLRELAVRSQLRDPEWGAQSVVNAASSVPGPPSALTDGVSVVDAVVCLVALVLRSDVSTQTSVVTVGVVDVSSTYTIDLTPHGEALQNYTYAAGGGDTADDIAAGLATDILTGSDFEAVASTDGSGTVTITRVDADAQQPYALTLSATATGTLTETHDASWAQWRWWGLLTDRTEWVEIRNEANPQAGQTMVNNRVERILCGGFSRIFIEVMAGDGTSTPLVGPGGTEE
jgi:hypothetical protein